VEGQKKLWEAVAPTMQDRLPHKTSHEAFLPKRLSERDCETDVCAAVKLPSFGRNAKPVNPPAIMAIFFKKSLRDVPFLSFLLLYFIVKLFVKAQLIVVLKIIQNGGSFIRNEFFGHPFKNIRIIH
jgi:hypothetical protein